MVTKEEALKKKKEKAELKAEDKTPEIIRDQASGRPSGFTYPDGTVKVGLSPKEIAFLSRKYGGQATTPQGTKEASDRPLNESALEVPPTADPLITPDQLAMVGGTQPTFTGTPLMAQDPLTADITETQRQSQVLTDAAPFGITGPSILNVIPGVGRKIADVIGKNNPKIRDFLQDYSNEDNYKAVKKNIGLADDEIAAAIAAADDPRYAKEAMIAYQEGMNKKRRSMEQLKIISDKDQRAYVDDVRLSLTELETYFNSQLKANDDRAMVAALQKANAAASMPMGVTQ